MTISYFLIWSLLESYYTVMSLSEDFIKTISEIVYSDNKNINLINKNILLPIIKKFSGVQIYEEYCTGLLKGLSVAKEDDLEEIFNRLGFGTKIFSNQEVDKNKKYMIVSNHPTGPLDGLFIPKVFHFLGIKGKLIGDDIMGGVEQLKDSYLGLSIRVNKSRISQLRTIKKEVMNGTSLAIFPAGSVSGYSLKNNMVKDYPWDKGFLELAKSNNLDIIPVYIDTSLTTLHYLLKSNEKFHNLSSLRLFREALSFVKRNKDKKIDIFIGNPIDINSLEIEQKSIDMLQDLCENLKFQSYSNIK